MKKLRRIFAMLLALSMTISMFGIPAVAQESSACQIVEEGGKVYYLANGAAASAENYDVWTSKTIAGTDTENEFEVTLQVGTTKKAETEDVAVILVMDTSTSMAKNKDGQYFEYTSDWKHYKPVEDSLMIDYAREAAQEFVAGLVNHAGNASVKLAMVEFGNNARTVFNWTEANSDGKVNSNIVNSIERLDVDFSIKDSEREECPWVDAIEEASFWGPVRDETGRCYYVKADGSYCELTDPLHTHNSKGADVCYWVERDVSHVDCTKCTSSSKHTHSVYDCWTDGSCSYPGCTSTTDSHTHNTYDRWTDGSCSYPGCTSTTDSHTHKVYDYWTDGSCSYPGCTTTTDSHTHKVYDYWVDGACTYEGCTNTKKHTHTVSDYWTPGVCSYPGCTNTTTKRHYHSVLDYWTPGVCSVEGCTNKTPTKKHKHGVLDYWTPGTCSYEGCTNIKKHKHGLYFMECHYVDANGETCTDTNYHTHKAEGHCTYILDNQPCTDTTPYHYHKYLLTDGEAGNGTFYWNDDGSMSSVRYVQTDANGKQHLCVDFEILRLKSCGTNMEGGLLLASNLLEAGLAKDGAIEGYENVYVILLSDGEPTYHVAGGANKESVSFVAGERGGGSKTLWSDIEGIVSDDTEGDIAYAEEIKEHAAFYTVMYGYSGSAAVAADAPEEIPAGTTVKTWLTATGKNMVGIDDLYMAEDIENGLLDQFGNIGERIELLSKAWTVTDALGSEVIFDKFALNGEYAEYDIDDHEIVWHIGDMEPEKADAAGTVKDPYVYTLKYKVTLNPDFNGVYEASADGVGVDTSEDVLLRYLMVDNNEDLKRLPYDELVSRAKQAGFEETSVKAFYADLAFTKLSAETEEALAGAGFTLYKAGQIRSGETFSAEDGAVRFEKLSAGDYELKETTVPNGYLELNAAISVNYGVISLLNASAGDMYYVEKDGSKELVAINRLIPPETVTVSGKKVWNDANNQDGKRPESITVKLMDGETVVDTREVTAADEWAFEFTALKHKIGGEEIVYTVAEEQLDNGYQLTGITGNMTDGFTITNTYTPGKISVTVTKVWVDGNNQDGIRPESVTVVLKADGQDTGKTVTLNAGNNWTATFTDLDEKANGQTIAYTVDETVVPEGYTKQITNEGNVYTITNTHAPETVSVSGMKVWADGNNQDGIRPDSVTIKLLADNQDTGKTTTATAGSQWKFSFTGLDKYKNGVEIVYTIAEVQVDEYASEITGDAQVGFIVTNSHTPGLTNVSVSKAWADGNNQDGIRPESVTVVLKADGTEVEGKSVVLSADNNWTYTWENLDKYKNGTEIAYTVDETAVPEGYTKQITNEGNVYTITNTHATATTSVTVTKVWDDNGNQDGIRPDSVTIKLLADNQDTGKTVVLNDANGWTGSFTDLPVKANGEDITYTVDETAVPAGYSKAITGTAANGFTVTNKHTASTTSITGKKVWNDGNDQDGLRPEVIDVVLYADGIEVNRVSINKEMDSWNFKFPDLPANKDGKAIVYTVDEAEVPEGYTKSVSGTTITNTHTPATVTVSGKKVWDDKNDQDGLRPTEITIKLLADGQECATKTVTGEGNEWAFEFANLPKFAAGKEISYSITEDAVTGYNAPAIAGSVEDGFTITNKHTPATVSVEGTKTWNDDSNRDGIRPTEITIRLKADGAEVAEQTVTGEGNTWTYSFTNLPKYRDGGVEIVYTITEDAVENYTPTPNGYDVTNTYAPGKTSVSVSKIWDDGEDYDGIRPEEIIVILLANGQATDKTVALNADNQWTATFTDLFVKEAGEDITYTVAEVEVEGYETEITGDATIGFTITNTHEPNYYEEDVVTVRKVWSGDTAANRPASVTVQLTNSRTGAVQATATLNAANGWIATFYVPAGEFWTVEELDVPANYISRVSSPNGLDFTVTNTYTTEVEEPRIPMGTPGGDDYIILDDDVPLADVPKTGDPLAVVVAMSALSGAGLFLTRKKREDEE